MKWRIVVNDQSGRYRIEIRRWWGWEFALDQRDGGYLSFNSYELARNWACDRFKRSVAGYRRWRIVDLCCTGSPSN